ncbi:MAG: Carbon monoxide dehydrogenase medium chain [Chloroflexi bacterium ADurb.Bin325]|nr:MAG: Carbon monoxide dehydrogenase medium chain [Chloroflexi bacterium ADurb.Bin325]
MQPFDYIVPHNFAEASALLMAGNDDTRPLLGGTDLLIRVRGGFIRPERIIDLKQLPGMCDIVRSAEGWLVIGAACTMNQVAGHPLVRQEYELLAQACESVASYQLRNRATVGGNCCNASPAADSAPALYCLEAVMEAYGPSGVRRIPIHEFFTGPRCNALRPGEFLTGIHLPPVPSRSAGAFNKLGRTKIGDISIVSVAVWAEAGSRKLEAGGQSKHPERVDGATRTAADGQSKDAERLTWRIAIGAAGPTPLRAPEAEAALAEDASPEGVARAAQLAAEAARPIDDIRASAAYRRGMVAVLARRGVNSVLARLGAAPSVVGGQP